MKTQEKNFFDSPNMINYGVIGILIILIILSQSFAIQSQLGFVDIFRSIINNNSMYFISLIYFSLLRFKFGKKYFDYLNLILFGFYFLTTFASLFTIFQSFRIDSILSLVFNVLVTIYFGYSFFTNTMIGKDLKLSDSPLDEISNNQYYHVSITLIMVLLVISLISVSSFQDVVVYILEAIYHLLLVRYIFLYKEYIDNKILNKNKTKSKTKTKKEEEGDDK